MVAGIVSTTASVFPAFLTGAVSVQLRAEVGVTEAQVGLAISAFFLTAALGSMFLGRLAEWLGASLAMTLGLGISIVTMLSVAAFARSGPTLMSILLAGGFANALTQPSANLLLAERVRAQRLGFGLALKQAGMPAATMLGGVAVPALALTVGWRWAYVAGAVVAALAIAVVPGPAGDHQRPTWTARPQARPDQPAWLLGLLAISSGLGATAAGAIGAFLVSSAEASGMRPAAAGVLLSGGSALGIVSRLLHGRWADVGGLDPLRRVTLLLGLGSVGVALLAVGSPLTYVVGTAGAFAFGWAWPGLFNLAIVRDNPSAPAAATGVTQTGVYLGALAGPALFGLVVDRTGYAEAWLGTAAVLLAASAMLVVGRRAVRRTTGTQGAHVGSWGSDVRAARR
jgi:predicted MFS family arabinose efflux permease